MIYVTGDTHGSFERFSRKNRKKLPFSLTEEDTVIVCGDFGLLWAEDGTFRYQMKWLSGLPFRLLWVQGNHENYDMIARYPVEEWQGGKVRLIAGHHIILLERGQVFQLEGQRFFTFGGASSHDIAGGILDRNDPRFAWKRKQAVRKKLPYRVSRESWWEEELPTPEEMEEGRVNLERCGCQVDYVITHCLSGGMQEELARRLQSARPGGAPVYEKDRLTAYFDELEGKLRYRRWFCGHYHQDIWLNQTHRVLSEDIIPLDGLAGENPASFPKENLH